MSAAGGPTSPIGSPSIVPSAHQETWVIKQCPRTKVMPDGVPFSFLMTAFEPKNSFESVQHDVAMKWPIAGQRKLVPIIPEYQGKKPIRADDPNRKVYDEHEANCAAAKEYTLIEPNPIGKGSFSKVYKIALTSHPKYVFAARIPGPASDDENIPNEDLLKESVFEESIVHLLNQYEVNQLKRKQKDCVIVQFYEGLICAKEEKWTRMQVFEHCNYTLWNECEKSPNHPLEKLESTARQLDEMLRVLNENGILHGDFSPKNIGVCDNFTLKLLDFGASRILPQSVHRGTAIGTARKLAAESSGVTAWFRDVVEALMALDFYPEPEEECSEINPEPEKKCQKIDDEVAEKAYIDHMGPGVDAWSVGCILANMYRQDKPLGQGSYEDSFLHCVRDQNSQCEQNLEICRLVRLSLGPIPGDLWDCSCLGQQFPEMKEDYTGPMEEKPGLSAFLNKRPVELGKHLELEDFIKRVVAYPKDRMKDPWNHEVCQQRVQVAKKQKLALKEIGE